MKGTVKNDTKLWRYGIDGGKIIREIFPYRVV